MSAACRACEKPLLPENVILADGCPCNSRPGINHGIVPRNVCTCLECDPSRSGSSRVRPPADLSRVLAITAEDVAREMHASWADHMRARGLHGPSDPCPVVAHATSPKGQRLATLRCGDPIPILLGGNGEVFRCPKFNPRIVPYEALPEAERKDQASVAEAVVTLIRKAVA